MKITINGKPREVSNDNLAEIVRAEGFSGDYFAVALNRACVPRSRHAATSVKDGDEIEILTPMQGG